MLDEKLGGGFGKARVWSEAEVLNRVVKEGLVKKMTLEQSHLDGDLWIWRIGTGGEIRQKEFPG